MKYNLADKKCGKLWYKGEWKENKQHGRGIEVFISSSKDYMHDRVFEGNFENGHRHGYGILTENTIDVHVNQNDFEQEFQNYYSYKGNWSRGVRQGFGVEMTSVNKLKADAEKLEKYRNIMMHHAHDECHTHFYDFKHLSQELYYETKYTGFFRNNSRMGEGCVELRDKDTFELVGWYLGRYENGVRHGLGMDIFIIHENNGDVKYKMIEKNYSKGHLSHAAFQDIKGVIVDDIMQNL